MPLSAMVKVQLPNTHTLFATPAFFKGVAIVAMGSYMSTSEQAMSPFNNDLYLYDYVCSWERWDARLVAAS